MWWLAIAAGAAALLWAAGGTALASTGAQTSGKALEGTIRRLAVKWGDLFGIPPDFAVRIASIESAFHPQTKNMNERAAPLGGAWGPMQVVLVTAKDIAAKLYGSNNPVVLATLNRAWHGAGSDLFDPDLGMMMGTWYLAQLYHEFQAWPLVAAAYQQGPGKVRSVLKKGATASTISSYLPPHGREYVAMAQKAVERVG